MINSLRCLNLGRWRCTSRLLAAFLLVGVWTGGVRAARAGVPDWLREAAQTPVPPQAADVDSVLLLDEQVTSLASNGEIKTRFRRALKILRPQGRKRGRVIVYFDSETRLTYLKAWSIAASGTEYEVKEKEAVEAAIPDSGELYSDTRYKILIIPAADPENIIGYEYEQRRRPYIFQDVWSFQADIPVLCARFQLELPQGWKFSTSWLNHDAVKPQVLGDHQWEWELRGLSAIKHEPGMPARQAVAGRMTISYLGESVGGAMSSGASWPDIGRWYGLLAAGRSEVTPEIRQKVAELTAGGQTPLDKIAALARFVQQDIRYVAITIGIGGYQPHPAAEVFAGRYGDCKDKATLLSAMLRAIGVDSYYVMVNTHRGVVVPRVPTALTFDHVILAIQMPPDASAAKLYALRKDPQLGRLLFFDPTDSYTSLGYLPETLQENYGLLVTPQGGELVQLPLLPPTVNRLLRVAKLQLTSKGTLAGTVQEIRWGGPGSDRRAALMAEPKAERQKALERFLGNFLSGIDLRGSHVENLQTLDKSLILQYGFVALSYAQRAGDLLLLRPRVLGEKVVDLNDSKEKRRKYPVEFPGTTMESDVFDITLPAGYAVDELPPPVDFKSPFGEYRSRATVKKNVLHYQRTFEIKEVLVPAARVKELKSFFKEIEADERSSAVLKQVPSPAAPVAAPR